MIEVKIESIRVSLMSPNQVVILKEVAGERRLPIYIGKTEGDAITFKLNEVPVPRPLTHDLAVNVMAELGVQPAHVVIHELRRQHFFAAIVYTARNTEMRLDARPSDAMAIAVRVNCPIYVEEAVMAEAGVIPSQGQGAARELGAFDDFISSLDLGDMSDSDQDKG
jgi:bifunctional DNase/RNase